MTTHQLKCLSPYFEKVVSGEKTLELRRDDRDFQPGDVLELVEVEGPSEYRTARECRVRVTHVLKNVEEFGLRPGFVAMSVRLEATA